MPTTTPELFAALAAPFDAREVRTRSAQGGRVLTYVTARPVMNRLDEVLGPENWWTDYEPFGQAGCKCRLSVRMPDGLVVTKVGIGGVTPMPDESDTEKTGQSDSFKRAAVEWGVGRYLYGDGAPRYADAAADANATGPAAPVPPAERPSPAAAGNLARPAREGKPDPDADPGPDAGDRVAPRPRTGKALFGWIRDVERSRHVRLMPELSRWAQANGLPDRMLDWDADQVRLAWRECSRRLDAPQPAANGHHHNGNGNGRH